MLNGSDWEPIRDRARCYAAGVAIRVAIFMVRCSRRLYRRRIFDWTGASHAIRWSDAVWDFGWATMKRKSARDDPTEVSN
jgi:hypothetical protein